MDTEHAEVAPQDPQGFAPSPATGPGTVHVDRVGTRRLVGRTERGVEIPIGLGPGEASPGELLKLALAGCAGMSADLSIGRRLGEDFALRVLVHGISDESENRYLGLREEIQLDVAGLDPARLAQLRTVIERAIEAGCTVERTVAPGVPVQHRLIDAQGREPGAQAPGARSEDAGEPA